MRGLSLRRLRARPALCRLAVWTAVAAMLAPLLPARAENAAPPADLMRFLPANAAGVATLDLRPESESARVLLGLLKAQDRALGDAVLRLLGQMGLSELGAGLDFDTDVLPWVGRRVALAAVPGKPKAKRPQLMLLAEVSDPALASKTLASVLEKAAAARKGKLYTKPVGEGTLRHLVRPGQGHFEVAELGPVVAASADIGLLRSWLEGKPGTQSDRKWARALGSVAPGLITAAFTPEIIGQTTSKSAPDIGISAAALSVGLSAAGSRTELVVDLQGVSKEITAVTDQIAQLQLSGEALAAVPAGAPAVVTLAPLGNVLKNAGLLPFLSLGIGGLLGPDAGELLDRMQPVMERLLAGEVTVAVLGLSPQPRWLGVLAAPDEDTVAANLKAFRDALGQMKGAKVADETIAGKQGFAVTLPPKSQEAPKTGVRGKLAKVAAMPAVVYFVPSGKLLLISGDREAVGAGITLAQSSDPTASFRGSAAYRGVREQLGSGALLEIAAQPRVLGRTIGEFAAGALSEESGKKIPPQYFARLLDAAFLPYSGAGLNLGVRDNMARLTAVQSVDWSSVSSLIFAWPALATAAAVAIPSLGTARDKARQAHCQSNLKQLGLAAMQYAADHDERLPSAGHWRQALRPYVKNDALFRCPSDDLQHPSSYAFNSRLSGASMAAVRDPAGTIVLFESTAKGNEPADAGASLARPARHSGMNNFAFADGHVKALRPEHATSDLWGSIPASRPAAPRRPRGRR